MSKDIWHKPSETTDVDNNLIINDWTNGRTLNEGNGFCWTTPDDIHNALEQITALEQKDK